MASPSCDGCGLPPRVRVVQTADDNLSQSNGAPTTLTIPLKKCTRCRQVSYHDVECQRKHYPLHKAACRQGRLLSALGNEPLKKCRDIVKVQKRQGQKCLVAAQSLHPGQFVPTENGASYFRPIVPPVLFRECRTTHCAICFCDLAACESQSQSTVVDLCREQHYVVKLCRSEACAKANDWLLDEVAVVQSVFDSYYAASAQRERVQFLPTALLVYRLLHQTSDPSWDDVLVMKSHTMSPTSRESDDPAWAHQQAVVVLVHQMICHTDGLVEKVLRRASLYRGRDGRDMESDSLGMTDIVDMLLSRIKYNAFTVTDSLSSLGIALYESPSYRINHSCDYNTVQSFHIEAGTSPRLRLDICRPVAQGDEICISYLDDELGAPLAVRRERLARDYCFHCRCSRCELEEAASS